MADYKFSDVPPLDWQTPIVYPDGKPTNQFQRLWQLVFGSGQAADTNIESKVNRVVPSVDNVIVKFDGVSGDQQGSNLTSIDNGSLQLNLLSTAGYEGTVYSNTANQNLTNTFSRARGTMAVPIKTNASDILGSLRFCAYNGSNFVQFGQLRFTATSAGDAATPTGTFGITVGANTWTYDNTTGFTSPLVINVPDDAYNATTWDGNLSVPTKNAIRDKLEAASGVTAGSYTNANITVDSTGKVTAASNGSGGGGGTTPAVVQVKTAIGSASTVVLSSAPTAGSLLIALATHFNSLTVGSYTSAGWTPIDMTNAGQDGTVLAMKYALPGESATQTPFVTLGSGSTSVFEVSGGLGIIPLCRNFKQDINVSPMSVPLVSPQSNSLLIGINMQGSSTAAFTPTGSVPLTIHENVTGTTSNNTPRRTQSFSSAGISALATTTVSTTFTSGMMVSVMVMVVGS